MATMSNTPPPGYLSLTVAANLAGYRGVSSILQQSQRLNAIRVGRRIYVEETAVRELAAERGVEPGDVYMPEETWDGRCKRCSILIFNSPAEMPNTKQRDGEPVFEWKNHENRDSYCPPCHEWRAHEH